MEKITKKIMYQTLSEMAKNGAMNFDGSGVTADAVIDFCSRELTLLENKAASSKKRATERSKAGDALAEEIFKILDDDFKTIQEVTDIIDREDITPAKVQYQLTKLAKQGQIDKEPQTIAATETSKARKVMGYRRFPAVNEG